MLVENLTGEAQEQMMALAAEEVMVNKYTFVEGYLQSAEGGVVFTVDQNSNLKYFNEVEVMDLVNDEVVLSAQDWQDLKDNNYIGETNKFVLPINMGHQIGIV